MRECALADLIAPNASHACLLVAGATGKPARGSAFHGVYFLTSQVEEEQKKMKLLLCIWPSSAFGPAENAEGDGLCVGSGDGILGGGIQRT